MNLSEIQADVSTFLGMTISATSRFTTTQMNAAINVDYRVCQSKMANANIDYYQGEMSEMDTTISTGRYQLPTGYLAMKRLEIQYDDAVDKKRANSMDINDVYSTLDPNSDPWSQSNPWYACWEDDFYIKPVPDATSSAWTTDHGSAMRLWFVELQDDLAAAGSVPLLPITYHHILAYGATAKGFRRLRKFSEADKYEALLRTGMAEMVSENTYKDKTKSMGFSIIRGGSMRNGILR